MATADVSYVPGALTAVAGDQCWVLAEAPPDSPAVTRIWQRLGQGAAAAALLAGLVADGLDGMGGFALLVAGTGGQCRLFCRGTVGATVVRGTADGGTPPGGGRAVTERVDGAGLLTWREHVADGAARVFLGEPPADTALRLPATSGVLLAGCVIIDLTNAAARDTVSYGQGSHEREDPGKTIVFFHDTITMTHPGSPGGPAGPFGGPARAGTPGGAGGPRPFGGPGLPDGRAGDDEDESGHGHARTVTDGLTGADGAGDPVLPGPFPPPVAGAPAGAPATGGYPGTGAPSPARHQETPPPAAQPGPPPGGPWSGGLIDAPPWLSGPAAPYLPASPRAGSVPGEAGATVKREELSALSAATALPDRIGPVVPALLCPGGHVNPPNGAACRRCGARLPHDPVLVPRPVLGVLRLSFGDVIMLDRDVLMGRNPRTDFSGTDGEERPHVVRLPSADGDISRTHLRVTLDGWHVLVTDLNSTNGTLVTLPGRDPQQLRPGEPMPIQPGTVVTLADGIDFRYEVTE